MGVLDILTSLSSEEFEKYVADYVLPVLDLRVHNVVGGPYDRGCDIIAEDTRFGSRVCVQVKRYSPERKVTEKDVRNVLFGMEQHRCDRGLIVTTSDLNGPALSLARQYRIDYINGARLARMVEEQLIPLVMPKAVVAAVQQEEGSHEAVEREVRDDGVFIPLGVTKVVEVARAYLKSKGALHPQLEGVSALLKRLYVFKAKASYKLGRRRSEEAVISVDAEGEVYEGVPTLINTVNFYVEYETSREDYYSAREIALRYITSRIVPEGAQDIKIQLKNHALAWVAALYAIRFKVGLVDVVVHVDKKGRVVKMERGRLTDDLVRGAYGGEVVRGDGYKVRLDQGNFVEELKLNEFGEVVARARAVKESYAVEAASKFFGIAGEDVRYKREGGAVKVDIFLNGHHHLAKVDENGEVVDYVVVPDAEIYEGFEKGYNIRMRALIVKTVEDGEEVVRVVTSDGVVDEKRAKRSILRKIGSSLAGLVKKSEEYSIDTADPLDLI